MIVIPSDARNPDRPEREPFLGMMKILRFAQDDRVSIL
jgi:hypothetical protein